MDEIFRFLHTWLTRRKSDGSPLYPELVKTQELDEIIPALDKELRALLARKRVELRKEEIAPDVAAWVLADRPDDVPSFRKAVAFIQLLSRERGLETVGKIDGRFGPKTQATLPNLEAFENRLIELVQRWLISNSHPIQSELGELGAKTTRALREELANDERVQGWPPERQLVAFGQLLCRRYGFEQVGGIDGRLGNFTRAALRLLDDRLARGPRIGLALSGGGFRASIFHLGVIRRLEELGIMSRVDVISSVSGGSIVAAYYLIEMERRLDMRPPPPSSHPSYAAYVEAERKERVKLFERIAADFLRATDHNLRMRALVFSPFFHPLAALKLLRPGYTRADLFQAEYDRWFFRGNTLAELPHVSPREADDENRRSGPKLVINTTSLLTGDRVAFSREPLSDIRQLSKVNTNVLRLSRIVGASAGVPGLFPPTPVGGDLLVDGGVSDNQGLEGLRNEGLDILLVSDASGQMERVHRLKQRAMAVLNRTNSIFQFQIRNQLVNRLLEWRRKAPPEWEREFAFVHLFLSLKGQEDEENRAVPSEYVAALGRIRTDLDEFDPVEREALMYHGYSLIDSQLKKRCPSLWKRIADDGWAPERVRDELATPRLFDEVMALDQVDNAEAVTRQTNARRDKIKRILEAGSHGLLILRSVKRHGLKAAMLLLLSWLLPLLLFMSLGWRPLEDALVRLVTPFGEALSALFSLSNLPGWLQRLCRSLLEAADRWSDWPITLRGLAAGALFILVNYVLIFFAFSVLRRLSKRWDAEVYRRLTAGGVPERAWEVPELPSRPSPAEEPAKEHPPAAPPPSELSTR